jgi:hypothetical protein
VIGIDMKININHHIKVKETTEIRERIETAENTRKEANVPVQDQGTTKTDDMKAGAKNEPVKKVMTIVILVKNET